MAKKKSHHQPFTILRIPTLVNKERVYPNKGILINEANDERYIYDMTSALAVSWIFGILSVLSGLFIISNDDIDFYYGTFSVLLIIIGLFFVIYGFTAKKENKMMVLNRLEGKVSYPDFFYFFLKNHRL